MLGYVRYGWTLPDLLGVEVKMGLLGRSSTEWLGKKFEKKEWVMNKESVK